MKKYFYSDGTNEFGPFTIEELNEKGITRETYVWFYELGEWKKAGTVAELKDFFTFIPPPIQQLNNNVQLPSTHVNTNSANDIVFLSIVYWFIIYVIIFTIQKLVPNCYTTTPWKYVLIALYMLSSIVPILFAFSVRIKTLKIISIILGAILSICFLYNDIDWLIRELKAL